MPQHQPQLGPRPLVRQADLGRLAQSLDPETKRRLAQVVRMWAKVKAAGGRVVVATGSGPNLHEGVTCMVAELVRLGLVDGVLTSSAVVGHEMAGVLERVRRVEGAKLGLDPAALPADGKVEVSLLSHDQLAGLARQTIIDRDLYRRMLSAPGNDIIKVAGNLAYPTGLWVERTARLLEPVAKAAGLPLEAVVGPGCDPPDHAGGLRPARRALFGHGAPAGGRRPGGPGGGRLHQHLRSLGPGGRPLGLGRSYNRKRGGPDPGDP